MMNPDFHMTLYVSEEVIKLVCTTIGWAVAVWGMVKIIGFIADAAPKQQTTVKETND